MSFATAQQRRGPCSEFRADCACPPKPPIQPDRTKPSTYLSLPVICIKTLITNLPPPLFASPSGPQTMSRSL
ncbi:uncharacterized protein B0I36DRAFT_308955 [Microdochium trichocladiopsis]|uniref:Uncharacterized protein n=1 Tax=Microdochium trichocladiopsis TaxID=1682393 RepID=A0A9P8YD37_9PEZI|nr:uncharacterized protein B0I36DRAFT_308955 [Microdochium trichocladiopsis]KAH7039602.1 hypothetical protein B0I36DRAFT_308955 [Microdochium trichocladiopsis]